MDLDVSIKQGRCKIKDGSTGRIYSTTEEALGLYLLRLNPAQVNAGGAVTWVDQLAKRGIAVGTQADRLLTLTVFPSQKRTIAFGRGDSTREEFTVVLPEILMPAMFKDGRLFKALMYVLRPGTREKLNVNSTETLLAGYPFGNVYNTGAICWGSTHLKDVKTPDDAYEAFFNSAFNGDLYSYNSGGLHAFLTGLKGDKKFPELTGSAFGTSVQAAVNTIARL